MRDVCSQNQARQYSQNTSEVCRAQGRFLRWSQAKDQPKASQDKAEAGDSRVRGWLVFIAKGISDSFWRWQVTAGTVLAQLPSQPLQKLTGQEDSRTTVIVSMADALPQPRLGPAKGETHFSRCPRDLSLNLWHHWEADLCHATCDALVTTNCVGGSALPEQGPHGASPMKIASAGHQALNISASLIAVHIITLPSLSASLKKFQNAPLH